MSRIPTDAIKNKDCGIVICGYQCIHELFYLVYCPIIDYTYPELCGIAICGYQCIHELFGLEWKMMDEKWKSEMSIAVNH